MCNFLQAQIWHEENQDTIAKLSTVSSKVSHALEEAAQNQQTMIENQERSLNYQREMVANGTVLSRAIEVSRANVKEILEEVRACLTISRIKFNGAIGFPLSCSLKSRQTSRRHSSLRCSTG